MIKEIKGYGDVNNIPENGTVEDIDHMIYLIIRGGGWIDPNGYDFEVHHNINEEFYITCWDLGLQHSELSIEGLVEAIRQYIAGDLQWH